MPREHSGDSSKKHSHRSPVCDLSSSVTLCCFQALRPSCSCQGWCVWVTGSCLLLGEPEVPEMSPPQAPSRPSAGIILRYSSLPPPRDPSWGSAPQAHHGGRLHNAITHPKVTSPPSYWSSLHLPKNHLDLTPRLRGSLVDGDQPSPRQWSLFRSHHMSWPPSWRRELAAGASRDHSSGRVAAELPEEAAEVGVSHPRRWLGCRPAGPSPLLRPNLQGVSFLVWAS